jgi:putative transcriptional regulator
VKPAHHPREETLLSLAAGTLSAGPRLVVATHLAGCAECRGRVRAFEAVGGALLESESPGPAPSDLLARALAQLDAAPVLPAARDDRARPAPPELRAAPAPLLQCDIGPWRFVQPGLRISRVSIPGEPDANVILLKVGAGRQVPQHGHVGVEYTQVLSGAFSDSLGHYSTGDCIEADEDVDHQPTVDREAECICLAAVEGRLRVHSLLGRLLLPLVGL